MRWGECLYEPPLKSLISKRILNLFFVCDEFSLFPFLHWFIFVAFGYLFGEILRHCTDKDKMYRHLLPVSLTGVLFVCYQHLVMGEEYYFQSNYYGLGVKNAVLAVFFVLSMFSFSHFAIKGIPQRIQDTIIARYSRNLNNIYCISWLLVSFILCLIVCYKVTLGVWSVICLALIVLIASDFLAVLYLKLKKELKQRMAKKTMD